MTDPVDAHAQGAAPSGRPLIALPIGHLVRISLYWLGLTAIDGAVGLFIQNRLKFDHYVPELEIGRATFFLAIPVAIVGILIQPTVGSISDYAVTRWGRRKPFIVVGSLLDLISLYGIATSNDVLALGAFVTLLAFTTNIARGPFQGYVPDLIAEKQVGLASALVGLMQILGNVTGFFLITVAVAFKAMPAALAAVAVVELVTMLAVVIRVGNGKAPLDRKGRSWASVAGEVWGTDILRERSYVWLVGSRLFFLMGGAMLVNYVIVYFGQTHNLNQDQANGQNLILLILVVIGNLIAVVPSARLSDRIGRKPVIYAACLIGFVGVGLAAIAPITAVALVGGFLFGASAGMFLAVDWALMTDIIPRSESGRYMGISNLATASSTVFALAAGGPVIDAVNIAFGLGSGPRAAYALGAAFYLVAIVLFYPVVEPVRGARARPTEPPEGLATAG